MAAENVYERARSQTLCICSGYKASSGLRVHEISEEMLSEAKTAVAAGSDGILTDGRFALLKRSVSCDLAGFTLDSIKQLPAPREVFDVPLTVEIMIHGESDELFFRSFTDLNKIDGVRALHTQMSTMEFLEMHFENRKDTKLSPFPFTEANIPEYGERNVANRDRFLGAMAAIEVPSPDPSSKRVFYRFNKIPTGVQYREVEGMTEKLKEGLGLHYFASTVNYQKDGLAQVGLAVSETLEELHSAEGRSKCLTMPPGAPPPIDAPPHIASMFDSVFYNNYGRHNPRISSIVTDFCWDWTGCDARFSPICVACSIQGKLFFQVSAAAPAWERVAHHFSGLGDPVEASIRDFLSEDEVKA
mmetsp:Transcript_54197/g.144506  ORF Transcript_54197/g.144506 Transcript_54197/m.144506 type:complete len:359 (+) Transcript_54197:484-1560(+)